jgi:hypothetical protein
LRIKLSVSIFFISFFIIIISGCTSSDNSTNTANITNTNAHGVFEDKYIKFNYPENIVVVDNSTSTECLVYLFSGTPTTGGNLDDRYIGDISSYPTNDQTTVNIAKSHGAKDISLKGTPALEYQDNIPSYNLVIPSKGLFFEIYTNQTKAYNTIKNSITIK